LLALLVESPAKNGKLLTPEDYKGKVKTKYKK